MGSVWICHPAKSHFATSWFFNVSRNNHGCSIGFYFEYLRSGRMMKRDSVMPIYKIIPTLPRVIHLMYALSSIPALCAQARRLLIGGGIFSLWALEACIGFQMHLVVATSAMEASVAYILDYIWRTIGCAGCVLGGGGATTL